MAIFLHLFLGVLRALEREVLQPGEHATPGVHGAHQLVRAAQTDREGQVLAVVLRLLGVNISSWTLEPSDHLQTSAGAQLSVQETFHNTSI